MLFGRADLLGRKTETRRTAQGRQKSAAPPSRRTSWQPALPAREQT